MLNAAKKATYVYAIHTIIRYTIYICNCWILARSVPIDGLDIKYLLIYSSTIHLLQDTSLTCSFMFVDSIIGTFLIKSRRVVRRARRTSTRTEQRNGSRQAEVSTTYTRTGSALPTPNRAYTRTPPSTPWSDTLRLRSCGSSSLVKHSRRWDTEPTEHQRVDHWRQTSDSITILGVTMIITRTISRIWNVPL